MEKLLAAISRLFLFGAFVLLVIAIVERIVNFYGYTILGETYTAGRMAEFSVVLLVFVIALTLRDLKDAMKR